jgi:hypothetical protein
MAEVVDAMAAMSTGMSIFSFLGTLDVIVFLFYSAVILR